MIHFWHVLACFIEVLGLVVEKFFLFDFEIDVVFVGHHAMVRIRDDEEGQF